jgi:hypothetical protein
LIILGSCVLFVLLTVGDGDAMAMGGRALFVRGLSEIFTFKVPGRWAGNEGPARARSGLDVIVKPPRVMYAGILFFCMFLPGLLSVCAQLDLCIFGCGVAALGSRQSSPGCCRSIN